MTQTTRVGHLLDELERELRRLQLWQAAEPEAEALASSLPFAVDTLAFHQWLQFVLLVRLRALLAQRSALPSNVSVYPMATEVYKSCLSEHGALLELIALLDEALSGQAVAR